MKKITLEDHYCVRDVGKYTPESVKLQEFISKEALLYDLTDMRIRAMDEGEIDIMVVSATTAGMQGIADEKVAVEAASKWNNYLAESIHSHTDRLRGFACLPMREPDAAIKELQRAVKDLNMVGAMLSGYDDTGNLEPLYYDAPEYVDFWKSAEALDVPIYLHPRSVPADRYTTYQPYPELRGATWGYHIETAEHILRMIMSGLFDKAPNLKVIIGHMGELLPFWSWRIDALLPRVQGQNKRPLKLKVTEYLQRNIFITTSGLFNTNCLDHAMKVMGTDRIMFSVDYPYDSIAEASAWFDTLEYDTDVLQAIAYDNAKRLLKI